MVKLRRSRWTRRRVAILTVALVILVGFIVVTLWLQSLPLGPRITIPMANGGVKINYLPTGNYPPINETAATIFATHFINDYREWADYEWNYQTPTDAARFFPLYVPNGTSWEVKVANEYPSGNRTEFLFITHITSDKPQMEFYTNVTAAWLRPFVSVAGGGLNSTAFTFGTPYGSGEDHLVIETAAGISNLPLFYDTNSSYVYKNSVFNAKSAAVALYNEDVFNKNLVLNPQYPQPGWLWNYANRYWDYVVAFSVVFGIVTGAIYMRREGIWPFHSQRPQEQAENGQKRT